MAYTQSKYEDGARALEYLILSERFVDGRLIASYAPLGDGLCTCFTEGLIEESDHMDSKLCLINEHVYSVIMSPVTSKKGVLGYDRLIFDFSKQIEQLNGDSTKIILLYKNDFQELLSGADMVRNDGEAIIFHKDGFYFQAAVIQDDIYFITKQSKEVLFAPIYLISSRIFAAGTGILIFFTIAVYLYVVRFAKKELINLESSHVTLKKAASEANIDPLTKTGSRRYGTEFLEASFIDFQTNGMSPAIIMFDIDFFKGINDTYGHHVGDQVLIEVADTVTKNIRSEDKLIRWGGDEFVAIIHHMKKENVIPFSSKILDVVSSLKISSDNAAISLTISMGVSYFEEGDTAFLDVLNRADKAMYKSKEEGRNRVNIL